MMNSISTSKIVVGIGLAAVFGIGVSVFAVRTNQEHDRQVALSAAAPATADATGQNAADVTAPAQSAVTQKPADQAATASSVPLAAPSVTAPTPAAPTAGKVAKADAGISTVDESQPAGSKRSERADRRVANARSNDDGSGTRVASAAKPNTTRGDESASNDSNGVKSNKELTPPPSLSDPTSSAAAGATADAQQASEQPGQVAAASAGVAATSSAPLVPDSQITAAVKSEIGTAAPNGNIDVTTTDGVVALAGSVPSQDAVDQARQAAQRVAGVKYVNASALTVSNQ